MSLLDFVRILRRGEVLEYMGPAPTWSNQNRRQKTRKELGFAEDLSFHILVEPSSAASGQIYSRYNDETLIFLKDGNHRSTGFYDDEINIGPSSGLAQRLARHLQQITYLHHALAPVSRGTKYTPPIIVMFYTTGRAALIR